MKITEIYEKYKIPPNLQLHQLRVAGVASIICNNFDSQLNKNSVIIACLLHDMGNILKFNFDIFDDDFYAPKGRAYWRNIKEEIRKKYGDDEHKASELIVKELSVSKQVVSLVNNIGFEFSKKASESKDYLRKICSYSDMRVAPNNVVSLSGRLSDLNARYNNKDNSHFTSDYFGKYEPYWYGLEKQIFEHCKIKPGRGRRN